MKKSIGKIRSLYPTPTVIVGINDGEKINFINITHTGVVGADILMLSMKKLRFSAKMVKIGGILSISVVDEALLPKADLCGMLSGKNANKALYLDFYLDEATKAPVLNEAKVCMICEVVDDYETSLHHQWMVKIIDNLVDEEYINEKNLVDFDKFKPVLFDNENWIYIKTGEVLGDCTSFGKKYLK